MKLLYLTLIKCKTNRRTLDKGVSTVDGSFASVNETIVKPRVAAGANTYTSDFLDVKFRVAALIR